MAVCSCLVCLVERLALSQFALRTLTNMAGIQAMRRHALHFLVVRLLRVLRVFAYAPWLHEHRSKG